MEDDFCKSNPRGCKKSDNAGYCEECFDRFILSGGKCHDIIPNCVGYYKTGRCSTCDKSFYLNTAGTCTEKPSNCNNVNMINSHC